MASRFRHEDVSAVPSGWRVRTLKHGDHRVRVAFPPGRKQTGSGRLVSILHPTGENPCTMRSTNPAELMVMGANPPRRIISDPTVKHQIKIAQQTLRMPDVMARVMGGMTKDQARDLLRRYGVRFKENPHRLRRNALDSFTRQHLQQWIEYYVPRPDRRRTKRIILATVKAHPDLLAAGRSWPEILRMGEASGLTNPAENATGVGPGSWVHTPGRTEIYRVVEMQGGPRNRRYLLEGPYPGIGRVWTRTGRVYLAADPRGHNPAELMVMGANPRVEVVHGENPPVEEIVEEFSGQEAKWLDVYNEPHMPRGRYAQLGELLNLYIKPAKGGQVQRITFGTGDQAPLVVTDSSARQIYFVNGNQDISAALETFGAQQRFDGMLELGKGRRIDYQARKEHVAEPDEDKWKHEHGEEDGALPTVLFDPRNKKLLYEGGNYRIEGAWIRN